MATYAVTSHPYRNQLLQVLPRAERDQLSPYLEPVTLSLGQVIHESNQRIRWGYFLTSAIVSLLYTMENGSTAEAALVGNDGVVGTAIFLGGERACNRAVVAVAGQSFRIPALMLLEEFQRNPDFQHVLLRYTHALITQISQTAVCNRLHSIEQRLCRQLLMCHDRTGSSELMMTQELIAHMLGGRRESVTVAAGHLQDLGLIHYCRGRITILNRGGLEASACECYRIVEVELARQSAPQQRVGFNQPAAAFEQAG
jgi:CRP-like cAMP-binding protein